MLRHHKKPKVQLSMGLCSSSDQELPRTSSWASADSANSNEYEDYGPAEDNEIPNTNLFGMKSDADGVMTMLRNNSASLTRLTDAKNPRGSGHVACQNQCGKTADDQWCSGVAAHLSENVHLTELHFGSGHHVQVAGAQALAKALKTNQSLLKLSLVYGTPGLGAQGTTTLAEVLPYNETLEILDLTSNAIGDGGAIGLAAAFVPVPGMSTQEKEAQEEKEEQEDEAATVVDVDSQMTLSTFSTLESVDTVWRPNDSLRSLLLSGNGIGTEGAISLSTLVSEGWIVVECFGCCLCSHVLFFFCFFSRGGLFFLCAAAIQPFHYTHQSHRQLHW